MDNMDGNPSQGGEPAMEAGDWRSQLPAASRQRIINKIMETLTRHLPFSGQEGLREIKIIAVRFEDKIYAAATSQSDYLRKISLKMLTMESNSQNTMTNSAGSSVVQPQVTNEGQLLSENVQSNILPAGAQFSAGFSCAQAATPALNMSALLSALPPSPGTDMPASTSSALPSPMDINMSSSTSELPAYGLIQSQPAQMQQQMRMLLQSNLLQRDMLQRIQESGHVSGSMLQTPNVMEQQQRLYQTQIALPETSSTSLGSTAQTELTDGADWQEEVYQKIKVMKEMYYPELSEMDQKIAAKLHHNDSLPQQPKSEQLDKLKMFKAMLERLMTVLQLSKSNISPGLKDKLGLYEKQIINFINTNKSRRPASLQAGQLPPPHMQSIEHSQSEVSLMESPANQMNPQLQSMKLQSSVPTMQLNNVTSLQQNYVSSLSGVSTAQQNMMNPLQPSSNMDPGQGTSLNSLQQVTVGSIQQTPVSAPQQANTNALSSQNGINMLQNNINPLQSNPGILHSQHLKQQEQQLYQNQLKQQYQQRQMQQQLMQKQQIIQQQQQQQQLQQQAKQQLPGQLQGQMPQLHQISDVNDVKIRPGMGVKPGTFQQHMSVGQRAYPHPQLKSVSPYPVTSSNQPLQSQSSQLSQHSSPQVDQQLLVPKAGTPLQNDSSPFVIPSPSTPIAPSPMSGESEKPSSLSNAGNVGHQPTAGVGAQVQSLAIGTPGISASPLLAEFIGPDGTHANAVSTMSGKSSVTEQPFERFIKAVSKASSIKAVGSIQETPGSGSQQANMNALSSESRINMLQNNIIPVQTDAGFLQQQQQLKLMILQSQQRHLQEQLMQKKQISQQKRQQEIQQLLRKVEPELPQVNVVNDMNTSVLLSSQSGSDMNQGSIDSLDSSSGMVGKQHQKQEQEEKLFQNQVKQPYQQLQMQQQWTQKPQMLQEKQQKQIQQLQQQAKQQLHHIYFIYILFLTILLGAYLFRADY